MTKRAAKIKAVPSSNGFWSTKPIDFLLSFVLFKNINDITNPISDSVIKGINRALAIAILKIAAMTINLIYITEVAEIIPASIIGS